MGILVDREAVEEVINEWEEWDGRVIERETKIREYPGKASAVIGVRRCGKTFLLLHEFKKRIEREEPAIFLSLDDDRLMPATVETMRAAVEIAKARFPGEKIAFFFDEVGEVKGWELLVKRLVEREGHEVYVTGSSAKLLSKEIATELRGRSVTTDLFPFSPREVLRAKGIETKRMTEEKRARIMRVLREYVEQGGFPEVVIKGFDRDVVRDYMDAVMYRDIAERYNVRNLRALRLFVKAVMRSVTKDLSLKRIENGLKSAGVHVSRPTLQNFLEYLKDAYAVFTLPPYTKKTWGETTQNQKVYTVDNAFIELFSMEEDLGKKLENAVFIELRRKGYKEGESLFYWRDKKGEADFVVIKENGEKEIIQVCWELGEGETRRRELDGAVRAMRKVGAERATVVTWDEWEEMEWRGRRVDVVPFWRWVLGKV